MTIKQVSERSDDAFAGFDPQVITKELKINYSFSKYDDDTLSMKSRNENENIVEHTIENESDNHSEVSVSSEKKTYTMSSEIQSAKKESGDGSAEDASENSDEGEESHFRLQFSNNMSDILEESETEDLAMDYPSLSPLDINEVKARRRELEARKFQEELDKMTTLLAGRLKLIPASSRRSYKKETIYVKDLYTLTYDEGQTLESIGYVSKY